MIQTYPLQSITLEEAMQFQFRMIDCITKEFKGSEILTRGDLLRHGCQGPVQSYKR